MRIDRLASSGPTFSFEFFPPKTEAGEENLRTALAELRGLDPSFVSVTYGAGGSTRGKTIEIVKHIREQYGLEAMAHFTCVGATVAELRATLDEMQSAGIDNVLALRDPPAGQERWRKTEGGLEYSRELVELIAADAVRGVAARGRARYPLHHAQPLPRHARDSQRAENRKAVEGEVPVAR
jgi:methylenetetrahydrofolate reductase (NADPH)